MSLLFSPTQIEDTSSGFSLTKRYFRKVASGNPYTITAGGTLNMATDAAGARINTGQPWLGWSFNNGVLSHVFNSTTVSGTTDSVSITTPAPATHGVTV